MRSVPDLNTGKSRYVRLTKQ